MKNWATKLCGKNNKTIVSIAIHTNGTAPINIIRHVPYTSFAFRKIRYSFKRSGLLISKKNCTYAIINKNNETVHKISSSIKFDLVVHSLKFNPAPFTVEFDITPWLVTANKKAATVINSGTTIPT